MTDVKLLLDEAYRVADDLDSNHARWVVQGMANKAGIALDYPPVSEPNNRLREQLAEAQAHLPDLDAMATWIVQETEGKDRIWDHACLECTGPTAIVIGGFRCAVHRARDIARHVTPSSLRAGVSLSNHIESSSDG